MKRSTTLFCVAIFVVLCISLLLLMDAPPHTDLAAAAGDSALLAKLEEIERQVVEHDKLVADVRKSLADVNAMGPEGKGVAPEDRGATYSMTVASFERVNGGVCKLAESPGKISRAEIQMMDIYNVLLFDNPDGGVWKQGFDITYSPEQWTSSRPLHVFVVPHTHNDPGWIKTFEKYFVDQTRSIHNLMVPKLEHDSRRKFIYAEVSFFSLWWDEQSDDVRKRVKSLIERGQLEIVTGGWVMTDEATAHCYSMIDQLVEGHEWLQNNLGDVAKPRSGWAVDPFGYASTMAYLLKRAGFHNMLIQRVHYSVKKYLARGRQLEFMWRQSWDATGETDIFCHMMPFYSYDVPHTCGPEPAVCCQFDFKRLPGNRLTCPWRIQPVAITDSNVRERAGMLLDQYRKKAQLFRGHEGASSAVVIAPLGDDFRYDESAEWDSQYGNYQKLFDHMNGQSDWHVKAEFGTLSNYFDAVRKDAAQSATFEAGGAVAGFPVLSGDFFTYADRDEHYWSGYFTSRPFYKHANRMLESHLRGAEIIYSIARSRAATKSVDVFPADSLMSRLVSARRNLALFQHHDAVAGTAREHVVIDYGLRLLEAWQHTRKIMEGAAQYLLSGSGSGTYNPGTTMLEFDLDEIRQSQDSLPTKKVLDVSSGARALVVYNSLGHAREELVRLHVSSARVVVRNAKGAPVSAQISPHFPTSNSISSSVFVLDFVVDVPALGLASYTVQAAAPDSAGTASLARVELYNHHGGVASADFTVAAMGPAGDGQIKIGNAYTEASFSSSGLLQSIVDRASEKKTSVSLQFVKYGVTSRTDQRSGAYLFLPDGAAQPIVELEPLVRVVRGHLLSEVRAFFRHVEHVVRLPNVPGSRSQAYEIENIVDITNEANFEIAMRLLTSVQNVDRDFYTDLNGFQILRRRTLDKLPLQANVYPMPVAAYIEDAGTRVSILSAESHGVASLQMGWLEVFLERRLMQDDGRGLNEPVKDNKRTRSLFALVIEHREPLVKVPPADTGYLSPLAAMLSLYLLHRPFVMPAVGGPAAAGNSLGGVPLSWAPPSLPCDVHLLNVRTQQDASGSSSGRELVKARRSAYIMLQRLAFDCSWLVRAMQCSSSAIGGHAQKLLPSELLPVDQVRELRSVSLTGLHDYGAVTSLAVPSPMHISTYRIAY